MVIVMVLLGCILGVVIHFTAQNMQMQSISMMRTIATTPFQQGIPGKTHDDQVRLPFFTVQISSRGEMIAASGGYFFLLTGNICRRSSTVHCSLTGKSANWTNMVFAI
jgi:hypothetical protein